MFLKLLRSKNDDGMAMVAVVGLMAVGLLLSSLILASTMSGIGFTSSTRAGVQSQASAEAGVAAATAGLRAGTCAAHSGVYTSATGAVPVYAATIWSQNSAGTWSQGCPVSGTLAVKIVSGGTAAAPGVAGQSGNDQSSVEAIYSTVVTPSQVIATGPAIYAYSSQGFSGSGTLVSADGSTSNVMVKEGDVSCSGGAGMAADLVVNHGNLTLSGSCNVTGSVWVSGKLTLSGGVKVNGSIIAGEIAIPNGKVGGNVWSAGKLTVGSATIGGNIVAGGETTLSSTSVGGGIWVTGNITTSGSVTVATGVVATGNLKLNGSDTINGSAWAGGNISTVWGGLIKNGATASTITMAGGDIKGMSWATTSVTHSGWYTVSGSVRTKQLNLGSGPTPRYLGTTTVVPGGTGPGPVPPSSAAAPAAPTIPAWADFAYNQSDWTGFSFATISGACDYTAFNNALASFGTLPGVIDARGCTSAISISSYQTITLQNDLAIIGNSFNLGGSLKFASAQHHKLWFITPDTVDNDLPTCTTGNFTVGGGVTFATTIDLMAYTPCQANISSGIKWRGQIFAGKVIVDGGAQITFVAVGLPNVDLSTGFSMIPNLDNPVWTLESTRNLAP